MNGKSVAWKYIKNAGSVATALVCLVSAQELHSYTTAKASYYYNCNKRNYSDRKIATMISELEQNVVGKAAAENEKGVIHLPYRICWNELDCVEKMSYYWKIIATSASNIDKELLQEQKESENSPSDFAHQDFDMNNMMDD